MPLRERCDCGSYLDNLAFVGGDFFNQVSSAEFSGGEGLNGSDGNGTNSLANELNLVSFNVSDDHNAELGQEVQWQLVDGVTENRFLDQKNVAASSLDLLAQSQNVLSLIAQHSVHLSVVSDDYVVVQLTSQVSVLFRTGKGLSTYVSLGGRQLELNQTNLGLFNATRTTSSVRSTLCEDETLDHSSVIDGTAQLLDNLNVVQVDVGGSGGVNHAQNGVNGDGSQETGVLRYDLGVQRGLGAVQQWLAVSQ
jgi:hypothetical protein